MFKMLSTSKVIWENGLVTIRLITGLLICVHGFGIFSHGHMSGNVAWLTDIHFPAPVFMAYLGKGAELVGGVLIMVGLFTRIAAVLLIINMAVITFILGSGKIFTDDQHPFLLLVLFIYLFFVGAGRLSLDHKIFNRD